MRSISLMLNSAVRRAEAPGLVAVAANSDSVIYSGAHGWRTRSRAARMTTDTVFRSSSLVRPIIAVAALQLVESGAMDMDDRVDELLPELRRSAFRSRKLVDCTQVARPGAPTIRQMIVRISDARKTVDHGELAALRELIERSSGRRLEDYMRRRILEPLGMTDTHFAAPASLRRRMADIQHAVAPGAFQSISRITVDPYALGSSRTALYSTPLDSMKFMTAVLREDSRLLSVHGHRELAAGQAPRSSRDALTYLGVFNTHLWIDKSSDTAGLLYTQLFPHNDPRVMALFDAFQTLVLAENGRPRTSGAA
jgi:CubicO group peptidase (beta-lactamase class C family)